MTRRRPVSVALYGALARLLPPDLREDRAEMEQAFAELRADAPGSARRCLLTARSLAALVGVLMVEWLEFTGVIRTSANVHGHGRGGMGIRNLRYALRSLRKAPAFSLTSILLVAVGVGAVTTIFTLVDHVLLRPLPYPAADRLITLDHGSFQGPLFRELPTVSGVEEWAGAWSDRINLVGEGDPLRIEQARISRDFFDLFGAHAQRGRLLEPEDFGGPEVGVLDAGTWRRVFGADPSVVGRSIELDGTAVTVVGIMEDAFTPPEQLVGRRVDVWRPLDWSSEELQEHTYHVLEVAGRLAPGVRREAVQDAVDALLARMADVHQNYRKRDGTPRDVPVVTLAEKTVRGVRTGLGLLMGAVSLLLLVACANVANLFLARGLGRTREMAVRRALGADTLTLAAQLLVESLVVGLAGGLLGSRVGLGRDPRLRRAQPDGPSAPGHRGGRPPGARLRDRGFDLHVARVRPPPRAPLRAPRAGRRAAPVGPLGHLGPRGQPPAQHARGRRGGPVPRAGGGRRAPPAELPRRARAGSGLRRRRRLDGPAQPSPARHPRRVPPDDGGRPARGEVGPRRARRGVRADRAHGPRGRLTVLLGLARRATRTGGGPFPRLHDPPGQRRLLRDARRGAGGRTELDGGRGGGGPRADGGERHARARDGRDAGGCGGPRRQAEPTCRRSSSAWRPTPATTVSIRRSATSSTSRWSGSPSRSRWPRSRCTSTPRRTDRCPPPCGRRCGPPCPASR